VAGGIQAWMAWVSPTGMVRMLGFRRVAVPLPGGTVKIRALLHTPFQLCTMPAAVPSHTWPLPRVAPKPESAMVARVPGCNFDYCSRNRRRTATDFSALLFMISLFDSSRRRVR